MTPLDNAPTTVAPPAGQPPPAVQTPPPQSPPPPVQPQTPTGASPNPDDGAKATPTTKPEGGTKIDVKAGTMKGDSFNFAGEITQIQQAVINTRSGGSRVFKFPRSAYSVPKQDQDQIAELFVSDQAHIADMCERLKKKRVLILIGETGIGKRTLAIYLASIVGVAENETDSPHQTFCVDPLHRRVTFDLKKICDDVHPCTFLIFADACEHSNTDLCNFLSHLNRFSLAEYSEKLRSTNSYLVFTITTADADRLKLNIDDEVQYRLTNLSPDLLAKGLEKRLAQSSREIAKASAHLEEMRKKQDTVISTLKTMPRVAAFVDNYLAAAGKSDGPINLEEALRRCDDVGYWFQQELSDDFEQWCFTLSLGLSYCLGDSEDVSWFGFESIRRSVLSWLKSDPELFPEEPEQNKTDGLVDHKRKLRLLDDDFLNACRAEIVKDNNSLSDLIVFRSRNYPGRLWETLLQHYRSILSILLPHLAETAETGGKQNALLHRVLCAQIIGRIGEIAPDRITIDLMDRWMYSDEISHQALVGALYQGILASNSERYRAGFLDRLNTLTNVNSPDEDEERDWSDDDVVAMIEQAEKSADKKAEKKQMLTLTVVYAHIGDKYFELAMKGLERIAEKKLVRVIENVQRVGRMIERAETWFQQRLSENETIVLQDYQRILVEVIGRLYSPQLYTFLGVQCALGSLCVSVDPLSVFKELRRWIKTSNQATGALVALMFLSKDGIAADLETQRVEIASEEAGSSERHSCNPIIGSLKSDESVIEMARFLVTLYESFTVPFVFPSQFTQYLEESLMLHLKKWAEESLTIEPCRRAVAKLFVELMRVHQGVLSTPVYRLLHEPKFGKKHPELKKAFVDAVLWQTR